MRHILQGCPLTQTIFLILSMLGFCLGDACTLLGADVNSPFEAYAAVKNPSNMC